MVIPSQCEHWRGNPPDNRNIFDSESAGFLKILGDRQEVNCPQGKRDHPGVHQPAGWFAMTVFFDTLKRRIRGAYTLYVLISGEVVFPTDQVIVFPKDPALFRGDESVSAAAFAPDFSLLDMLQNSRQFRSFSG